MGYHTSFQVLVGSLIGTVIGGVWFYLAEAFFKPLYPLIEDSPFFQYFYVRDTSDVPDVMRFEYENVRSWKKANAGNSINNNINNYVGKVKAVKNSLGAALVTKKAAVQSALKQNNK